MPGLSGSSSRARRACSLAPRTSPGAVGRRPDGWLVEDFLTLRRQGRCKQPPTCKGNSYQKRQHKPPSPLSANRLIYVYHITIKLQLGYFRGLADLAAWLVGSQLTS